MAPETGGLRHVPLWCPPPVGLDRNLRGLSGSSPRSFLIKICARPVQADYTIRMTLGEDDGRQFKPLTQRQLPRVAHNCATLRLSLSLSLPLSI